MIRRSNEFQRSFPIASLETCRELAAKNTMSVTNTPAFTNPDTNPADANFGRITGTRLASERQMQMAVRFLF